MLQTATAFQSELVLNAIIATLRATTWIESHKVTLQDQRVSDDSVRLTPRKKERPIRCDATYIDAEAGG